MPGAHKIDAVISGPRITGGKIMDMRLDLKLLHRNLPSPLSFGGANGLWGCALQRRGVDWGFSQ